MLALISLIPGVGPVLAWLAANKTFARVLGWLLLVLFVIGLLVWTHHLGAVAERQREAIAVSQAAAEAETKAAAARSVAATQSTTDAAAVAASTEGLKHADDAQPDSVPDPKQRAFDCERLRRAGVKTAGLGCPG